MVGKRQVANQESNPVRVVIQDADQLGLESPTVRRLEVDELDELDEVV